MPLVATVENPLLNPACAPEISSTSSANLFNLLFRTAVNVLLRQELSVILSFGKKLYCSFVDLKSAFDTVWRLGLWQKLQKSNIQGKIFKVIYNLNNMQLCLDIF
jgi:hypothetical protein